eukprot:4593531-Pyramimonas_sp.AAC.1
MQMATISGLYTRGHARVAADEVAGAGGRIDGDSGPIWRAGAEAVEAQRGVVTAVLEMLPSFLADKDLTIRATAGKI